MRREVSFHLEDFDGPFDLLLGLVQKNKMNLKDIEIVALIDQYLEVMDAQAPGAMDSTSEFVAMAARLVRMKSAMLLPRSEEADRMREELTGLLVEYSACKEMAVRLKRMAENVFIAARRPAHVVLDSAYQGLHTPAELAAAFAGIIGRSAARRMPSPERFEEIVSAPVVSVAGRVIYLLRGLTNGAFERLKEAFTACRSRSETVATFLALLELIRGGRIAIDNNEELRIKKRGIKYRGEAVQQTKEIPADGT